MGLEEYFTIALGIPWLDQTDLMSDVIKGVSNGAMCVCVSVKFPDPILSVNLEYFIKK